jgi:Transposase DDE domain group 1
MVEDTLLPFSLPSVQRKKVTAAFDGGRITSDGGVMLLAAIETSMGIAAKLAPLITDRRNPLRVTHGVADILRARMLAIACGYEDADDLDQLRSDPGFKLACGRLPESGAELCSQPTVSRWENATSLREVVRMTYAMVDIYCASYPAPPRAVTLDIDDTLDVVHGHQQLALFNGHYGERCFLPIHVYDTATSRPVAMLLRPGTTPSGAEIRCHLRRLVRRIRRHWPHTKLTIRGDGHYGRPEVMAWCEANGLDYILGLPGNAVLDRLVELAADEYGCVVPRLRRRWSAGIPRRATAPNPGIASGGWRRASRRARKVSIFATSLPTSRAAAPNGCMTPGIVPGAKRRT